MNNDCFTILSKYNEVYKVKKKKKLLTIKYIVSLLNRGYKDVKSPMFLLYFALIPTNHCQMAEVWYVWAVIKTF